MFRFAILETQIVGKVYSDLTGEFTIQSFHKHLYLFICYIYSENAITMKFMKDFRDKCMMETLEDMNSFWEQYNQFQKLNMLDKECSVALQKFIQSKQISIQFLKSHNY